MKEESQPSIDGTTAYVMQNPAGIGASLDDVLAVDDRVRHVVVCGDRPGAGKTGCAEWANRVGGDWFHTRPPTVTRSALRARLARPGVEVAVTRAEPWFGEGVEPYAADGAMRYVRNVCAAVGVRPFGTPASTGRAMIAAAWQRTGREFDPCPQPIADLLRSTSGQGRFQVFDEPASRGGDVLVNVDARFQYGALAQLELPVGTPVEVDDLDDVYAPSWCEVWFTPTTEFAAIGLLGVNGIGGWHYPVDGGPHRTWASGAEIHLAREHGYVVEVRRAIVWPKRARPLGPWASRIEAARDRLDDLPLPASTIDAARDALRAIVLQTIGGLHGRTGDATVEVVPFASANETVAEQGRRPTGAALVASRPEWSVAIWSTARVRLARAILDQSNPVVACALDGFYVDGEPDLDDDDGRSGRWRVVDRIEPWAPITSLADVYALKPARRSKRFDPPSGPAMPPPTCPAIPCQPTVDARQRQVDSLPPAVRDLIMGPNTVELIARTRRAMGVRS